MARGDRHLLSKPLSDASRATVQNNGGAKSIARSSKKCDKAQKDFIGTKANIETINRASAEYDDLNYASKSERNNRGEKQTKAPTTSSPSKLVHGSNLRAFTSPLA